MTDKDDWRRAFDAAPIRDADFDTMSGQPVDPVYGPDDGEFPGQYPYTRGPYASMYRSKLWTMRMFAGFGTPEDTNHRFQRDPSLRGRRSVDRVRPAHTARARLRRPRQRGRGGQVWRRRRHARGHGRPLRGHRPRHRHNIDDDQLTRGSDLRHVRRSRGGERCRARPSRWHAAERHPEGVPRAERVRVPAEAVDATRA